MTEAEVIERAAEALWKHFNHSDDWWSEATAWEQERFRGAARAAIGEAVEAERRRCAAEYAAGGAAVGRSGSVEPREHVPVGRCSGPHAGVSAYQG